MSKSTSKKRPRTKASLPSPPKKYKLIVNRRKLWLTVLGVTALITVICAILFISIDARVREILNTSTSQHAGMYYSAFDLKRFVNNLSSFTTDKRVSLAKYELTRRSYSEVKKKVEDLSKGEFSTNGSLVYLALKNSSDKERSGGARDVIKLDLTKSEVMRGSTAVGALLLEPEVLSHSEGNIRASRFVPLSEIPLHVQQSVLATEDERFYSHFGLDLLGIARAIFTNVISGRLVQGGSTITQQLAKNVVLSPERSLKRKVLEIFAALSLEFRLSKKEILERYLNEVYLGQEGPVALHGFPEASQSFFGKRVQDLTPDEAALLAGIIKAPSYFSPRRHLDRAIERQSVVLGKMHELGYLSSKDTTTTTTKPRVITILPRSESTHEAPHFAHAVEKVLSEHFSIDATALRDLRIETGLDLGMQQCAQAAVSKGLAKDESTWAKIRRTHKPLEAGLVTIEPFSGLIKAWVGGRSYSHNQFDHVSQGTRQIGSTIKPFLYLTALDSSLNDYKVATAVSVLEDAPQTVETGRTIWEPENYDKDFRGDVTLRYALENSLNLPAIYVAERVGIPAIIKTVERFELAHNIQNLPSLALGALDTSLLRLASGYAALANGGVYIEPRLFTRALDSTGLEIAQSPEEERRIAGEAPVFVLTDMLRGVVERGTANGVRRLGFTRAAAGKTGTSDSTRDAWFIGFTPTLVTAVWVGFDDNKRLGLTGGQLAVPIWTEFMKCAAPLYADTQFVPPPDVVKERVDVQSGLLASSMCPSKQVISEVFVKGTEPQDICDDHKADEGFFP